MRVVRKDTSERIKTCRACKSEIAYKTEDVKFDRWDSKRYIKCPVCNESITVSIFDRKVKDYGNIKKREDTAKNKEKEKMS